ncbi:hypothetical protein SAMD00019534_015170 [Acytostelium subglobosum LB1]|uniref:hypothetical protein n=1 Tax=Acytostelium subglobosum LB1 TaxID=1410327 RepID=UPI000644F7E5|nr:hypothetical protein SAMD00019534_015170 [Acytostelium subglobosum LB1]GAM18342.1 hypothetical protein SAMD00019534_015170 [Acytostelium subglobosum LB1]|eukprot:XP_012757562.1 hypothetical protein SAMD00019534_015170 [Acytostelium subglobosum LB1]
MSVASTSHQTPNTFGNVTIASDTTFTTGLGETCYHPLTFNIYNLNFIKLNTLFEVYSFTSAISVSIVNTTCQSQYQIAGAAFSIFQYDGNNSVYSPVYISIQSSTFNTFSMGILRSSDDIILEIEMRDSFFGYNNHDSGWSLVSVYSGNIIMDNIHVSGGGPIYDNGGGWEHTINITNSYLSQLMMPDEAFYLLFDKLYLSNCVFSNITSRTSPIIASFGGQCTIDNTTFI